MHNKNITIHWFRQDLRLSDNPALYSAAKSGFVLPVYILDDVNAGKYMMGATSRCWLHYSLHALNKSLHGKLLVYSGDPEKILLHLIKKYHVTDINWNRSYEPWQIKRDIRLKKILVKIGVRVNSFNGSLLWEPWDILKSDKTPYSIFTPFYHNGCLKAQAPRIPLTSPDNVILVNKLNNTTSIDQLGLLPKDTWYRQLFIHWRVGEVAAKVQLNAFLASGIDHYKEGRNYPAKAYVSKLSPYLHFGELSPNQAWYASRSYGDNDNIEHFCSELAWREFSYNLIYYNPNLPRQNLQTKFDDFPWRSNQKELRLWQKGQTGIPIVDAGMRELWQTGYMHNRVRMIVASFLVKNLLLDWRSGEQWFWDCLVDADLANNSASWQWVAGCGADAAPYYRIFNPTLQGQKFDQHGKYTRHFIPELKLLPDKYLFNPWDAPAHILTNAGIKLGIDYPLPIVDLNLSRQRALNTFKQLTLTTPR